MLISWRSQERINKNVNELSQKLLEGCKLLSESCPETNVPLVSTTDGRMYSVGNGCYYAVDRNTGTLVKVDSKAAPRSPMSVPHSPVTLTPSSAIHNDSSFSALRGASGSRIISEESAQTLSARVAQKLLDGFTLLSESCPTTNVPLVQNAAGQVTFESPHL